MLCKQCGAPLTTESKFCDKCGAAVSSDASASGAQKKAKAYSKGSSNVWIGRIIWIVIILALGGWGVYSSQDQQAVTTSNSAVDTFNSNDSQSGTQSAIQQFQTALSNATDNSTKLTILKNLAFAYDANNDTTDELSTWQQALQYAPKESSDYYLVSGEIAELQNEPGTASEDLNQANTINPNDYQISNTLGLFYLDLSSSWTAYDSNPKALQYLQESYNLENDDVSTVNLAVAEYYNNDYQQSISLLTPLNIAAHPAVPFWIGRDYAAENDVTDAKIWFQKGIAAGAQVPQDVTEYMNSH